MADKEKMFEVVISGVGGKFPKSENIEHLKMNLCNKVNMVTENDCRWAKGMFYYTYVKYRITIIFNKNENFQLI